MLTDAKEAVSPCRRHRPSAYFLPWVYPIFCHINCPLLHNLIILDWRVMEFCLITFLGLEKREDYLEDSSSRDTFNAPDTCRASVGSVSDESVASSSARFFTLYIYGASSSFPLFHLCWFLREKVRRLWFRQFIFYFCHFIHHQS